MSLQNGRLAAAQRGGTLPLMLALMAILFVSLSIPLVKTAVARNNLSVMARMLRQTEDMSEFGLYDAMAAFSADRRVNYFDPNLDFSSGREIQKGNMFVNYCGSSMNFYDSNAIRVDSFAENRKRFSKIRTDLRAMVVFRQDAPRFEWVLEGDTNLNTLPSSVGGVVDRTVYVKGDLKTLGPAVTGLSGFWVVNGTVSVDGVDTIGGQVRCKGFLRNGLPAFDPNVIVYPGFTPLEPEVNVNFPTDGPGLQYYFVHHTTTIARGTNPITIIFNTGDPNVIQIDGNNFTLSPDYNVIVSTGANLILQGPARIGRPLVIVALPDGPINGDITVQGDFSPYTRWDGAAWNNMPGAFRHTQSGTECSVSFAVLTNGQIFFDNPVATTQNLVGYYHAGAGFVLDGAPHIINLLGTLDGMITSETGVGVYTLNITADGGLAVQVPRGFPRRPSLGSIFFQKAGK